MRNHGVRWSKQSVNSPKGVHPTLLVAATTSWARCQTGLLSTYVVYLLEIVHILLLEASRILLSIVCYFTSVTMGLAALKARTNDIVSGSVVGRYFHLEGSGHVSTVIFGTQEADTDNGSPMRSRVRGSPPSCEPV